MIGEKGKGSENNPKEIKWVEVFKRVYEVQSTISDRPTDLCPHGDHILIKKEYNNVSFLPHPYTNVITFNSKKCEVCDDLIGVTLVPIPPKPWTKKRVTEFYTNLLGWSTMWKDVRFEPLRNFLQNGFPYKSNGKHKRETIE